jgi:hypothetical protein
VRNDNDSTDVPDTFTRNVRTWRKIRRTYVLGISSNCSSILFGSWNRRLLPSFLVPVVYDTVPHNRWHMLLSTAMLGWLQARDRYLFLQLLHVYSHYGTHKRNECLWESRFVNFSTVVVHDTGISSHEQTDTERISFFPRLLNTKYLPAGGFVHITRAITLHDGGEGGILLERAFDCLHRRYCDQSQ